MISFYGILKTLLTERMSFRQLLQGSEAGRKKRGRQDVKARSIRVATMDNKEAWTFNYKSDPSTTGHRWHGYIQFFKDNVAESDSAEDLECMVDCDCPDYRYRYAYNNAQADVGRIGAPPNAEDWKHPNQNNGRKWRPRSQGGVGDYGVGLCKHLCGLADFLKTQISPEAPEPDDPPPSPTIAKKPVKKPLPPAVAPQTSDAPDPEDDSYTDSRAGSDTLMEKIAFGQVSPLYRKIDELVKQNPEFDVQYEDPD